LNQYATAVVAVKLRRSTKAALLEKFLNAKYEAMSTRARGTIVNDINLPAESLTGAITQLAYFLAGVFNSVVMVALLLCLSWWATLLIGVLAIGGVQGWRRFADRRSAAHGRTLYDLRGEQNKLQVDAIDGLKIVKAHGLERRMVQRQDALLAAEWRPELQLVFFSHGPTVVNEVIAVAIAPDGTLCGFSDLRINRSSPSHASVGGTLVLPAHRGHRLGLAMKLATHRRLVELFPDCAHVETGNAGVNAAMNAVNSQMGYRVVERCLDVQKRL